MSAAIGALPPGINPANVRRAYEVKPMKRKRTAVYFTKDKEGKLIREDRNETVDGFMVYFPQKHSLFVESEAMLKQMNLHHPSGLVDMETGIPIEMQAVPSLAPLSNDVEE